MHDFPEYKHTYRKIKCFYRKIFIDSTSTYQYVPEKNVYILIKSTCSMHDCHSCNGIAPYGEPCSLINPLAIEVPPNSSEFDSQGHLID